MRRFKHIPTNKVVEYVPDRAVYIGVSENTMIVPYYIVETGKDWEEIKEKEWEIELWYDGKNTMQHSLRRVDSTWTPFKVKRLSDGVEFKIGNKIKHSYEDKAIGWEIKSFHFRNNDLSFINCKAAGYCDSTFATINDLVKIEELFTTEDGVDIYNPEEEHWFIPKDGGYRTWRADYKGSYYKQYLRECLIFSSKTAAEEYILMNEPRFSINDAVAAHRKWWGGNHLSFEETLKQIAKS